MSDIYFNINKSYGNQCIKYSDPMIIQLTARSKVADFLQLFFIKIVVFSFIPSIFCN
jgi:hypothetical protein